MSGTNTDPELPELPEDAGANLSDGVPEPDGGHTSSEVPPPDGVPTPDGVPVPDGVPQPAEQQHQPPSPFVPPSPEELAPLFPNLVIEEMIAAGGMGAVYKVLQPQLDRHVALKILPPESGEDVEYVERFGREAKLMAQLNHPNIVSIFDFGNVDGLLYFIMEFVDGQTIHEMVQLKSKIPAKAARLYMLQVSAGLKYAHDKGVLHLDIKPGNLMINREGVVKILDFGLASLVGGEVEKFGTPLYTAPERYSGETVDCRADIFSLGAVFYEMLVGTPPSGAYNPAAFAAGAPAIFDQIITKCLQPRPADRFQDAGPLIAKLKSAKNARPPVAMNAPSVAKPGSSGVAAKDFQESMDRSKSTKLIIGGVICSVLIAVALIGLFGGPGDDPDKPSTTGGGGTTLPSGEDPDKPSGDPTGPGEEPVKPVVKVDRSPKSESRLRADSTIPHFAAPKVGGRKVEIYALIEAGGGDGVVVKHGNDEIGYSLYFKDDRLHFSVRAGKDLATDLKADRSVEGKVVTVGATVDANGLMTLMVNGEKVAEGAVGSAITDQPKYGVFVGDTGLYSVGDYPTGSKYQGFIQEVVIRTFPPGAEAEDPFKSTNPFG